MKNLHLPPWRDLPFEACRSAVGLIAPRTPAIEHRADADDGPEGVLFGHFSVFNRWYEINSFWEGNFMERVAPGAFRKTFADRGDRIRVLLSHGGHPVQGDLPIGTPRVLEEDDVGARYEVDLFDGLPGTLRQSLAAGQMGASFAFRAIRDEWLEEPDPSEHNPKGLPERTLTELFVREIGPTTFGANDGATAGIRSATDQAVAKTMPEEALDALRARRHEDLRQRGYAGGGTRSTRAADPDRSEPSPDTRAALRAAIIRIDARLSGIH